LLQSPAENLSPRTTVGKCTFCSAEIKNNWKKCATCGTQINPTKTSESNQNLTELIAEISQLTTEKNNIQSKYTTQYNELLAAKKMIEDLKHDVEEKQQTVQCLTLEKENLNREKANLTTKCTEYEKKFQQILTSVSEIFQVPIQRSTTTNLAPVAVVLTPQFQPAKPIPIQVMSTDYVTEEIVQSVCSLLHSIPEIRISNQGPILVISSAITERVEHYFPSSLDLKQHIPVVTQRGTARTVNVIDDPFNGCLQIILIHEDKYSFKDLNKFLSHIKSLH